MDAYLGEGRRGQQMGDIDAARVLFRDQRISFPSGGGFLFPVQGVFLFGERSSFLPVEGVSFSRWRCAFCKSVRFPPPSGGDVLFPVKAGLFLRWWSFCFPGAWGYSCLRPRRTISATVAPVQLQNRDTSNGTLSTSLRCGRTASMPRGSLVTPPPPSVGDGAADTGGGGSEARSMQEFQSVSKPSSWPKALVCRSEERERQTKRMPALKRS